MEPWPFADPPNVAVLTTRHILAGLPVLLVSHDLDDGAWQFLTDELVVPADGRVVGLGQMIERDASLAELADLPAGWQARRERLGAAWVRRPETATQPRPARRWTRRRVLLGIALLAAVLVLAVGVTLDRLSPYAVIVPSRAERTAKYHDQFPASFGLTADHLDVEVEPEFYLRGYFLHAKGPAHGTVVLLHGHGSCKESMYPLAKLLSEHGYNSLAYDSRGHGESGGQYCTYGYYEHHDCSKYVDEAQRQFGPLGPLAIMGQSFGGAVALQTLAADHRLRCGVVESTFATLRGVVQSDARRWLHVSLPSQVDRVLRRAGEIAHFPATDISPEHAAGAVQCPVLVIHGTADERIPLTDGQRIYQGLHAPGCEWYPVPGAGHEGLWHTAGHEYEGRILDFLARYEQP